MIIVRSPLRITLGGGGTDIPAYAQKFGGFALAAAIDKYVCISLLETFMADLTVRYSRIEHVVSSEHVEHPIVREAMHLLKVSGQGLELSSMADIPAGTGLGSSSSFTCALLKTLHTYKKETLTMDDLAAEACWIEIHQLREPIGQQDQYVAAYGGVVGMHFSDGHQVAVQRLVINNDVLLSLEENLLLFFTGYTRSASTELRSQNTAESNLHKTKELGLCAQSALEVGDLDGFAHLLNEQWLLKQQRSPDINLQISAWRALGLNNGAIGSKLVGAGGGGFLLFYTEDRKRLRTAMRTAGLREVHFRFDHDGTTVLSQ